MTIYVREDALTPAIDQWLGQLFDDTCAALEAATGPDIAEQNRLAAARKKLTERDDKLAKHSKLAPTPPSSAIGSTK